MAQAIQAHFPNRYDTPVRELMIDYGFGDYVAEHKASWRWQLEHPWSITLGQPIVNAFPRTTQYLARRKFRAFAKVAAERLNEEQPALVVGNHPFMVTALTMAAREYGLEVPVVHFQTTTLDTSSLWAVPGAERYLCASPVIRDELGSMGVEPETIDVIGYPVRQEFLRGLSKSDARGGLGLSDAFTCLIMLGGEGVGESPATYVDALRKLDIPVQVVVIAGRNPELQSQLEQRWQDDDAVRIEGFVDNVADFQFACDVFIGKTGPASVMETLAVGRPILAPRKVGTSENRILAFVEARELGHFVPTMEALVAKVREYHDQPESLEAVRQRAHAFDFPAMAERVAHYLVHYAEHRKPDLSLRSEGIH
jgi:UDP-N-acetylglucosamine:LPS N-acetylglucosamine transferase